MLFLLFAAICKNDEGKGAVYLLTIFFHSANLKLIIFSHFEKKNIFTFK